MDFGVISTSSSSSINSTADSSVSCTGGTKRTASSEAAGIIEAARHDAAAEAIRLRDALRNDVAALAVKGAEQILRREVNASAHADLLEQLKAEL